MFFSQHESEIIGKGEKWLYNGKELHSSQRRILEYVGTISGNELKATFTLHGEKRISHDTIVLEISFHGQSAEGFFSAPQAVTRAR